MVVDVMDREKELGASCLFYIRPGNGIMWMLAPRGTLGCSFESCYWEC